MEARLFDWELRKAVRNIALGRMSFEAAAELFKDPRRVDFEDNRFEYGEERRITIGAIEDRFYTVVYTMRGATTWIISARPAHRKERRRYG